MTDKNDQDIDTYLKGKSPLSERYVQASDEVPAADIDQAILAASKKAVNSGPKLAYSPFSSNWHVPVSLAAVLILCVTLVVNLEQDLNYQPGDFDYPVTVSEAPQRMLEKKSAVGELNTEFSDEIKEQRRAFDLMEIAEEMPLAAIPEPAFERQEVAEAGIENEIDAFTANAPAEKVAAVNQVVPRQDQDDSIRPRPVARLIAPESAQTFRDNNQALASGATSSMDALVSSPTATAGRLPDEVDSIVSSSPVLAERLLVNNDSALFSLLSGNWIGRRIATDQPYEIHFTADTNACMAGIEPGKTSPGWIFCESDGSLDLTLVGQVIDANELVRLSQTNTSVYVYTGLLNGQSDVQVRIFSETQQINMTIDGKLYFELSKTVE